jgi:hypothetical protein
VMEMTPFDQIIIYLLNSTIKKIIQKYNLWNKKNIFKMVGVEKERESRKHIKKVDINSITVFTLYPKLAIMFTLLK